MDKVKYSVSIEQIKMRIEESFYKLDHTSLIYVSQQIYKYASKGKTEYLNSLNNMEVNPVRNTVSMKDLE